MLHASLPLEIKRSASALTGITQSDLIPDQNQLFPVNTLAKMVTSEREVSTNEEISEELIAMAAIFPESEGSTRFHHVQGSRTCLVWEQGERSGVCLFIDLPLAYPEAAPQIRVAQATGRSEVHQLLGVLQERLDELTGTAMLYDVVMTVQCWVAQSTAPAA
eukprot:TRINITY_DN28146_c0_g1_i2.p1 TRINITY_DN28146_c0_g1~~TRINITY_DN28146_c0_g1_i2.p1  ORF type:complete len:162 (-),score=37.06 TRINITY_DN28146_c0_g1_i2:100-585(-)